MIVLEKMLILKSVSLFKKTPDDVLYQVAEMTVEETADAGQTIIQQGELGTTMYVIVEGRVRIHDEHKTLTEMGAREVFGELSALSPEKRLASVSAMAPTFMLKMDYDALYECMNMHIGLAHGIIQVLCQRVREIALQKS